MNEAGTRLCLGLTLFSLFYLFFIEQRAANRVRVNRRLTNSLGALAQYFKVVSSFTFRTCSHTRWARRYTSLAHSLILFIGEFFLLVMASKEFWNLLNKHDEIFSRFSNIFKWQKTLMGHWRVKPVNWKSTNSFLNKSIKRVVIIKRKIFVWRSQSSRENQTTFSLPRTHD